MMDPQGNDTQQKPYRTFLPFVNIRWYQDPSDPYDNHNTCYSHWERFNFYQDGNEPADHIGCEAMACAIGCRLRDMQLFFAGPDKKDMIHWSQYPSIIYDWESEVIRPTERFLISVPKSLYEAAVDPEEYTPEEVKDNLRIIIPTVMMFQSGVCSALLDRQEERLR